MLSLLETDAYDCGGFDALYFGLFSYGLTSAASCYLCSCITSGIIRSKFNFNDRLDFFKVLFNSDGNLFVPSKIFNCDALFKVVMFYPLNSNWVDSFSLRVPWDYFFFKMTFFVFFFLPKVDWVCFNWGESYLSYWRIISCILFSVLDKLGSTFTFFALNYGTFRSNFFTFVGFGLSDFRTLGLELCVILKLRCFRVSDSVIIFRGLEFFTETAPLTTASLVFVVSKLFYMVSLMKQGDSVIGIVSVLVFCKPVSVLFFWMADVVSVNMILFFWKPELS